MRSMRLRRDRRSVERMMSFAGRIVRDDRNRVASKKKNRVALKKKRRRPSLS